MAGWEMLRKVWNYQPRYFFITYENTITEKEYMKKTVLAGYEKHFIMEELVRMQEEKDFIAYAREHHLSYSAMMK